MDISTVTNKTDNIAIIVLVVVLGALGGLLIYYIKHSLAEKKRLTDMLIASFEESKEDRRRYEDNLLDLAATSASDHAKHTAAFSENTRALQGISRTLELVPTIQGQVAIIAEGVKEIIKKG